MVVLREEAVPVSDRSFELIHCPAHLKVRQTDAGMAHDYDRLLALCARRIPSISAITAYDSWSGIRDTTPDDHGILGPITRVAGLYVAAGFAGHGFMHALGIAEILADMVADRRPAIDAAAFSPARFATSS